MRWIDQEKGGRELGHPHPHPHPPDCFFFCYLFPWRKLETQNGPDEVEGEIDVGSIDGECQYTHGGD